MLRCDLTVILTFPYISRLSHRPPNLFNTSNNPLVSTASLLPAEPFCTSNTSATNMLRQPSSSNLAEPKPPRTCVDLVGRLRNPYRHYTAELQRTAYVSAQVEERAKKISAQRVFREHHQIRTDARGCRAISKITEEILYLAPLALFLIVLVLLVITLHQGLRNALEGDKHALER
jgi:hypothetical protein